MPEFDNMKTDFQIVNGLVWKYGPLAVLALS